MMGTQGSTDGREPLAGRHVDGPGRRRPPARPGDRRRPRRDGGHIKDRPVTPGDLAATIYRHMGVPLDATYLDATGRPRSIVEHGEPIAELF